MENIIKYGGIFMSKELELFWNEVREIQNCIVNVLLINAAKYEGDLEKLLNDATFETICSLMELIDGVSNNELRGEIISTISGECINSGVDLHDCCEDFLECSDI